MTACIASASPEPLTLARRRLTLALCCLVAILEGADILSMAFAVPKLRGEFAFTPNQIAIVLASALAGLMVGSAYGGWLSDRIGRKKVLIAALIGLGVFSLLTTVATTYGQFVVVRILTGLGLGGAFPMLIAIASEVSEPRFRARGVSIMYCGQPIGGVILGMIVALGGEAFEWRNIFYIGGFGPFLLIPLLIAFLPETHRTRSTSSVAQRGGASLSQTLFGEGRTPTTLLLWAAYVFTLLAVYLILTWLPSLVVDKGFSKPEAAAITSILNVGAALGCYVLAQAMDRGRSRAVVVVTYLGMVLSLMALAAAKGFALVAIVAAVTGFFVIGGQFVLYALAPRYYPEDVRGTGVGITVSMGRVGAICGPLLAGVLISRGVGALGVIAAVVPAVMIAGVATFVLVERFRRYFD